MSLIDTVRPRGRAVKNDQTPIERALAAPLPDGAEAAVQKVETALNAFKVASDAHTQHASAETKLAAEGALRVAEAALSKAIARRTVADRLGDDDGPSDAEIAALEDKVEAEQLKVAQFTPTIRAYEEERERRRQLLKDSIAELEAIFGPYDRAILDASDEQTQIAADMYGQAVAAVRLRTALGRMREGPSLASASGSGVGLHGATTLPPTDALENIYRVLFTARRYA